ncbi:hypothetical protein BDQ17DRAFT_1331357 [Cyathus striatus]|nr:hypothetical protein BDQ17DRAFT_1331357 [Cyathus striatus]
MDTKQSPIQPQQSMHTRRAEDEGGEVKSVAQPPPRYTHERRGGEKSKSSTVESQHNSNVNRQRQYIQQCNRLPAHEGSKRPTNTPSQTSNVHRNAEPHLHQSIQHTVHNPKPPPTQMYISIADQSYPALCMNAEKDVGEGEVLGGNVTIILLPFAYKEMKDIRSAMRIPWVPGARPPPTSPPKAQSVHTSHTSSAYTQPYATLRTKEWRAGATREVEAVRQSPNTNTYPTPPDPITTHQPTWSTGRTMPIQHPTSQGHSPSIVDTNSPHPAPNALKGGTRRTGIEVECQYDSNRKREQVPRKCIPAFSKREVDKVQAEMLALLDGEVGGGKEFLSKESSRIRYM